MDKEKYNPYTCRHSMNVYDTFICRLATIPCGLYHNKKCYLQEQDEAIDRLFRKEIGGVE